MKTRSYSYRTRVAIALLSMLFFVSATAYAQKDPSTWPKHEFSIVSGLTQPLLFNGFNLEVEYFHRRWAFAYSHGINLEYNKDLMSSDDKRQQLTMVMPWSTGFGVGYQFTRFFTLMVEPKFHRHELYYDGTNFNGPAIAKYTTATLGIGAYYRWLPFKNKESWVKGLTITPALRYWPLIASSESGNEVKYFNQRTGQNEVHKMESPGMGGIIYNIKIGYSFSAFDGK